MSKYSCLWIAVAARKPHCALLAPSCITPFFVFGISQAAVVGHLGGQNTSGVNHFTIETDSSGDGIIKGAVGSTMQLVPLIEINDNSDNATEETVETGDNGTLFISEAAAITKYHLPACGSEPLEASFAAADANAIIIDTDSSSDTIKYLTLDAGDAIRSNAAIGDCVTLNCYKANTWIPSKMGSSVWTDAGDQGE